MVSPVKPTGSTPGRTPGGSRIPGPITTPSRRSIGATPRPSAPGSGIPTPTRPAPRTPRPRTYHPQRPQQTPSQTNAPPVKDPALEALLQQLGISADPASSGSQSLSSSMVVNTSALTTSSGSTPPKPSAGATSPTKPVSGQGQNLPQTPSQPTQPLPGHSKTPPQLPPQPTPPGPGQGQNSPPLPPRPTSASAPSSSVPKKRVLAPGADQMQLLLPSKYRKLIHLTPSARKYTHPIGQVGNFNHKILKDTGKSGFCPFPYVDVTDPNSDPDLLNQQALQRARNYGFSADDLDKMGALTGTTKDSGKTQGKWTNPIHPLYERHKWEKWTEMPKHLARAPMLGDLPGFWSADNDVVWDALEIVLRMASAVLASQEFYPWWDALFFAHLVEVPKNRLKPEFHHLQGELFQFNRRTAARKAKRAHIEATVDQAFRIYEGDIRFRFIATGTDMWTGLPNDTMENADAYTTTQSLIGGGTWVCLSVELLQSLFRTDLNEAEMYAARFRAANSILHETAHAIWRRHKDNHPYMQRKNSYEPFFEDEIMNELGWSLEKHLWGGVPQDPMYSDYARGGPWTVPALYVLKDWFEPDNLDVDRLQALRPETAAQAAELNHCRYPIPTTWMRDVFQPDLWEFQIPKFGSQAGYAGPLSHVSALQKVAQPHMYHEWATFEEPEDLNFFSNSFVKITGKTAADKKMKDILQDKAHQVAKVYTRIKNEGVKLGHLKYPDGKNSVFFDAPHENDLEVEPDPLTGLQCARWKDIVQFLLANRDGGQLALDTMTFDIAEPVLLRYIIDRGFPITGWEFREFLVVANRRKVLFHYEPYPGRGTVRRIPNGWPYIPPTTPLGPRHFDQAAYKEVEARLNQPRLQRNFVKRYDLFRDMDEVIMAYFINSFPLKDTDPEIWNLSGRIRPLLREFERVKSPLIRQGPLGIARMNYPVPRTWTEPEWSKVHNERYEAREVIVKNSEAEQLTRIGEAKKAGCKPMKLMDMNDDALFEKPYLLEGE